MEQQGSAALPPLPPASDAAGASLRTGACSGGSLSPAAVAGLDSRMSSARSSAETPESPFTAEAWLPPFPQNGVSAAASLAPQPASRAGGGTAAAPRAASSAAPAGRSVSLRPAGRGDNDKLWPRLAQMALVSGGGAPPQPPPQPAAERQQLPPVAVPPSGAVHVAPAAAPASPATPPNSACDPGCSTASGSSDACSNGWAPPPAPAGAAAAPAADDAAHDLVRQDTLPAQLRTWWIDPSDVQFLRDPASGRLRELGRGAR